MILAILEAILAAILTVVSTACLITISYISCMSFAPLSFAQASRPSQPVRARAAEDAFLKLDFFAEGRGLVLSPDLISAYNFAVPGIGVLDDHLFTDRWGLVYDDNRNVAGLHQVTYNGHRVGLIGCAGCHSGRAAGQFIVGLGNKNIDVFQLGTDVNRLETVWRDVVPFFLKNASYVEGENFALDFSEYLGNPSFGNLTQGLVPVSFIQGWFYKIQNREVPDTLPKGQVKVPFLWGYGEKRKVGQFCDGFGDGNLPGWAVAVELTAGQHPDTVRAYYDKIVSAENMFSEFLPPPYPFEIDQKLASQGKSLFEKTCAHCHGQYTYDENGAPIFQAPNRIPWAVVKTDEDRLRVKTPDFIQLVSMNPLNDIIKIKFADEGYFAPRLNGVWARFPYLHNGSVPSIADLLTPEDQRPQAFSMRDAGEASRFDNARIGLTLPAQGAESDALLTAAKRGDRDVYWTGRIGHSNTGHPFFTNLLNEQKMALLEYLKTL